MVTIEEARAELAPRGAIRVGINLGNAALARNNPDRGGLEGLSVDIANAVGEKLGVPVEFVTYPSAGKVYEAADRDEWDMCFLAIEASRKEKLQFSRSYFTIEATCLVPAASPLVDAHAIDIPDVRIVAASGSAYELFLSGCLEHATVIRTTNPGEAFTLFSTQELEALAGIRPTLEGIARANDAYRVLTGSFLVIDQGVAVRRGNVAAAEVIQDVLSERFGHDGDASTVGSSRSV